LVEVELHDSWDDSPRAVYSLDNYHYNPTVLVSETLYERYLAVEEEFRALERVIRNLPIHRDHVWR